MMDNLPKSVRVGPHDIRFTSLSTADAAHCWAQFSQDDLTIELMGKYPSGSMAADAILHELFHAIFLIATLKDETLRGVQSEERIVSSFGTYFAQIIRDNPELIKWMLETVKK